MKFKFFIFVIILLAGFFIWQNYTKPGAQIINNKPALATESSERTESIEVVPKSTYGTLMAQASVTPEISAAIFGAAKVVYDLSNIQVGRVLNLTFDKQSNELKKVVYPINSEEELFVTKQASSTAEVWLAERLVIPYEIKTKIVEGTIDTSMYQAAIQQGIDERAVIAFADVFQWSVDFAWQVRQGDIFRFVYEERYRDGKYVMPGKILAGKFINDGKKIYAFYFQDSAGNGGYFDQDGNSVQKIFLKTPVAFKYISSGFTTGQRYVEAFNVSTGHRAIDYAAAYGTPIRTVGDGTVVFAGWNGAYGQKVSIRHNSTYTTNYGHMSKIAVKYGQKVVQGQTIGYVGSTGFSTGPHLHYEMVKSGVKINPFYEDLPAGQPVIKEDTEKYFQAIKSYQEQLGI